MWCCERSWRGKDENEDAGERGEMPEEQLEEEEGRVLGTLESRPLRNVGVGGAFSRYVCFLSDSGARSSTAWVNMGRRDWRFGNRGEGMCLPPRGCVPRVTGSLEGGQEGGHNWRQHSRGWRRRGEGEAPPVVCDF